MLMLPLLLNGDSRGKVVVSTSCVLTIAGFLRCKMSMDEDILFDWLEDDHVGVGIGGGLVRV